MKLTEKRKSGAQSILGVMASQAPVSRPEVRRPLP